MMGASDNVALRVGRLAGSALAVWGLAGCAGLGPPVVPLATPVVAVPDRWLGTRADAALPAAVADRAAAQASLPAPWAGGAQDAQRVWWAALGDAQLNALVAQALQAAPDVRTAQARLREARARREATAAAQGPSLTLGASGSRNRSSGQSGSGRSSTLWDAGFDASWEADVFGRVAAGVAAAEADLQASAANLADVRLTLAGEVARLYLALRGTQRRQAVAEANRAAQADTLQIARWRAQAGLVGELDVVQAQANLAQTEASAAALQGSLASARLQLELLLGQAPGALQPALGESAGGARAAATALPMLPPEQALVLPADVLRQRPDVRLAEAQWRAEGQRSTQARAAQAPRLTLSGSLGLQALTLGTLGQGGYAALAAGLAAPLFDGGALRAQLAAQVAVQDRYAVAYERAMLAAFSEVEDALATLDAGRRQALALAQAVQASRRAADLARLRYRSGLVDFRSVLDAERSLLATEDSLASTQTAVATTWVQLHKALGAAPPPDA